MSVTAGGAGIPEGVVGKGGKVEPQRVGWGEMLSCGVAGDSRFPGSRRLVVLL